MPLLINRFLNQPSKVHYKEYIRTENTPVDDPTESPKPAEIPQPDTK